MNAAKNKTDVGQNTKPKKRGPGRPRKNKDEIKIKDLGIDKINELQEKTNDILLDSNTFSVNSQEMDSIPKWSDILSTKIDELTQKISIVDQEFDKASTELIKIDRLKTDYEIERVELKKLITQNQDRIYKFEQRMIQIDPSQYRPNLPDFLRPLFAFLTGEDDEILLRIKISKDETKISQRKTRLVTINEKLSEILINENIYLDYTNALKTINDSYREIRMSLGRIQRDIIQTFRDQQNEETQNFILKNYLKAVENLKSAGSQFDMSLSKTKQDSTLLFDRILKLKDTPDFPENLNKMVNNLLRVDVTKSDISPEETD